MGFRLIVVGLAILLVVIIIRHLYRRRMSVNRKTQLREVDMVCCARCGVHLPKPEAISGDNKYYCCVKHLEADDNERR